jgi:hypothetical protein
MIEAIHPEMPPEHSRGSRIRLERDQPASRRCPPRNLQRVNPDVRAYVEAALARRHAGAQHLRKVSFVVGLDEAAEPRIQPERLAVDLGPHAATPAERVEQVAVDRAEATPERRVPVACPTGKRGHYVMDAAEKTPEPLLDQAYFPGSNVSATPLMQ